MGGAFPGAMVGNGPCLYVRVDGFRPDPCHQPGGISVTRFARARLKLLFAPSWGSAALWGGLAVAPLHAQTDAQVQRALDAWYKRAKRRAPGEWGIAVADQTGRILWSVAEDQPLLPASTVKLFTTGFARSTVGGDARLATRVVGTGAVEPTTGLWVGTWALEMNGDLSLERTTRQGPQLADLAHQLAAKGITQLQGPLVVQSADGPADATFPSVWASRHRGRLFAPPFGAITLHENIINLSVRPGAKTGARPIIVGESPRGVSQLVVEPGADRRRTPLLPRPLGHHERRLGAHRHDRSLVARAELRSGSPTTPKPSCGRPGRRRSAMPASSGTSRRRSWRRARPCRPCR